MVVVYATLRHDGVLSGLLHCVDAVDIFALAKSDPAWATEVETASGREWRVDDVEHFAVLVMNLEHAGCNIVRHRFEHLLCMPTRPETQELVTPPALTDCAASALKWSLTRGPDKLMLWRFAADEARAIGVLYLRHKMVAEGARPIVVCGEHVAQKWYTTWHDLTGLSAAQLCVTNPKRNFHWDFGLGTKACVIDRDSYTPSANLRYTPIPGINASLSYLHISSLEHWDRTKALSVFCRELKINARTPDKQIESMTTWEQQLLVDKIVFENVSQAPAGPPAPLCIVRVPLTPSQLVDYNKLQRRISEASAANIKRQKVAAETALSKHMSIWGAKNAREKLEKAVKSLGENARIRSGSRAISKGYRGWLVGLEGSAEPDAEISLEIDVDQL